MYVPRYLLDDGKDKAYEGAYETSSARVYMF